MLDSGGLRSPQRCVDAVTQGLRDMQASERGGWGGGSGDRPGTSARAGQGHAQGLQRELAQGAVQPSSCSQAGKFPIQMPVLPGDA